MVDEKIMPRLRLVCGIVVNSHGDDEFRRENSYTSTDGDPAENINCSAAVALIVHKVRSLLPVPVHCGLTRTRLAFVGLKIDVQWYCPPAVG